MCDYFRWYFHNFPCSNTMANELTLEHLEESTWPIGILVVAQLRRTESILKRNAFIQIINWLRESLEKAKKIHLRWAFRKNSLATPQNWAWKKHCLSCDQLPATLGHCQFPNHSASPQLETPAGRQLDHEITMTQGPSNWEATDPTDTLSASKSDSVCYVLHQHEDPSHPAS